MKSNTETKERQAPSLRIDPALNKYTNVILFPEKVDKLKASIEKFGMPDFEKVKNQNCTSQ